jgi:lysophospholipase L1-like esterase
LDQEKAWPALLQAGLGKTVNGRRVWVGNLDKAGFNTRDHLALMRLVIEQYDVDAIVMLIGGNDMVHRLMQGERYDPHFVEDEARYRNWVSSRFWMVPLTMQSAEGLFFKRTALWRLAKQLKYLYLYKGMVQDDTGAWLVKLRKLRQLASLIDELPPIDSGLNEYRRNVEAIIQEARRHSIRVVLLTQPTLWKTTMPDQESDLLWMGGRPDGSFYTSSALARAMNSYNQQLLDTCAKLEAESIDLAASVPRTLDIFYDDMHFTETGAQRVAADLVAYFRMRAPFSASSH